MNKREEIFKVFCKKDYCSDSDDDQYPLCVLKEDCRNVSYVDSILSIINRIPCPECKGRGHYADFQVYSRTKKTQG